ncbi:MAG: DUF4105 domain-containing protein [Muribaculaceae bacterium]|nr:DUF4105 domain-containing protein [Muribaculaceae bacterium]
MRFLYSILLFATILLTPFSASSQYSDSIKISILTCYPGPQVYELYGHTAIRVQQGNRDVTFNYGIFSFSEPNFIYRFVKGDANYMLSFYDFEIFFHEYQKRHSKVVEQQLNLNQQDSQRMLYLLLDNALPENRNYRYNYIYDNCSTRPRDIIERTIGSKLKYGESNANSLSFRDIMRQYNANYPWQAFGIDLALGYELDHNISNREKMFAPIYLLKSLEGASYTDSNGITKKLVTNTVILNNGSDSGAILPPTPWYYTPCTIAWYILLITVAITIYDQRRKKINKIYDSLLYFIYGCAGCIIFFLIFVSIHAATSPNLVGLWLHPFYLIPAIIIWIKPAKSFLNLYQMINFAQLLITVLLWGFLPQSGDCAFVPLMLIPTIRQLNYIIINRQCVKTDK